MSKTTEAVLMPSSNTIDSTIDAPVINWNNSESEEYKLVLVGVKEVEKNWLRRVYYRNVPEFKSLPEKNTRYCVLLLENKFIPGTYKGEATYFEIDPFAFRKIKLEKSKVDLFREKEICHGTINCEFENYLIDEKFILPSIVKNGTFEYQEISQETINKYFNAIVSESSQSNKCERLENIVQMHSFAESIFYGRTSNYSPSQEKFSENKILSLNKILGTDPFERDLKYWKRVLPAYFFHSSEGLKNIHLKDYQNAITYNVLGAVALISSSFIEFFYNAFDIGTASFISGSLIYMDAMFRSAYTGMYMKSKNTLDNKPGIIGAAVDFVKYWKSVFIGNNK